MSVTIESRERSAQAESQPPTPPRTPFFIRWLHQVFGLGRRLRRWFSRREWGVRLLGLPTEAVPVGQPGLVLIQLDGLSRGSLEKALQSGQLPFLRRLLRKERYRLHSMYSGIPSTTPAVQGELFFGKRAIVPAFSFRDHRTGEVVQMTEPAVATRIQNELAEVGPGLLEGGSAYSNIYAGGAAECHLCAVSFGWNELLRLPRPRKWFLAFLHSWGLLRVLGLFIAEFFLALRDCVVGLIKRWDLWHELKFVPRRAIVSAVLRELITIGAEIDLTRGLPIVQLNYLGYDEQAHHRGPKSRFAMWTLRGIDAALERVWNAAHGSPRREYQVWIYSDHGQQATTPYSQATGETLHEAIARVWAGPTRAALGNAATGARGSAESRARWLSPGKASSNAPSSPADGQSEQPLVVAIGPIGFLYQPGLLPGSACMELARRLVHDARIPLVLTRDAEETIWAINAQGEFRFPDQASAVLGESHPFLEEAAHDLAAICNHPDAGPLVLSGYRPEGPCLSFVTEQGAHGGPGPQETHALMLLPEDAPLPGTEKGHFRPSDLRKAVQNALHPVVRPTVARISSRGPKTLRVMTYNVHSCVGTDGKLSPARIARVIAQSDPDLVCLQELDVGRPRSGGIDQAEQIAQRLGMHYYFYPALRIGSEYYGHAILSRYPLQLVNAAPLPGHNRFLPETRGAVWTAVELGSDCRVQVFNTHLGLHPRERLDQVNALLSADWLGHPDCGETAIFCGDLNAGPGSPVYRALVQRLQDAQILGNGHRPFKTWFSGFPVARIDHIFVGSRIRVRRTEVPRNHLTRLASDHLPLIADLEVP